MCIAIIKPAGVKMPVRETLDICFANNPHGCGYTLNRNGVNYIFKGFTSVDEMCKSFEKTCPKQSETVMIHFRVASHGEINAENCHPFPVSSKYSVLKKTEIQTWLPTLVHNGTFYSFKKEDNKHSDTMNFVKSIAPFVNNNYLYNSRALKDFLNLYVKENNSRVAVLYNNGVFNAFGEWIHDKNTNLYFSNLNYRFVTNRFSSQQLEFDF